MGIFGTKKEDDIKQEKAVDEKKSEKKTKGSTKKKEVKNAEVSSIASAYNIDISPIITEKSHGLAARGKYTFRVKKKATKAQIKNVVEEMYKVNVTDVNVVIVKPKRRTVKYDRGYQSLYKKAVVTVKKGDHIAVFEGA
ncbi:MAG: 50S ribosomal protein L23 [Candidatus Moraniibacteriota bacterium]|nr:MAG: 50S ribosomal protein L23 [Candidatus Moranbacteria bacterium]